MFKTTVTAWLVRLAITWVGAGVIAFLVADYVLRSNVEAVGVSMGEVSAGIGRLEESVAAQAAEIAALKAAVEAAEAPQPEADPVEEADPVAAPEPEAVEEPAGETSAEEAAPEDVAD